LRHGIDLAATPTRGRVRARGAAGWLANGLVGGAVAAMIGLLPVLAFGFILASDVKFILPGATQALNVLDNDYCLPVIAGFIVFGTVAALCSKDSRNA
jgi:hypothetical protein